MGCNPSLALRGSDRSSTDRRRHIVLSALRPHASTAVGAVVKARHSGDTGLRMSSEWSLRREICEIGRRVYARGLAAGTDGNLSARLSDGRCLITPSGSCLGLLDPGDLVTIDAVGRVLTGRARASSERWMHLAAYARRPDIAAAIHAHPPTVIAFTVAGVSFSQCALPEVILAFGQIPVTAYATPGTEEGAGIVCELIERFDALVLDRHGSLTVGSSVTDAYNKLDKLEHGARVLYAARQLVGVRDLPPEEVAKLAALRESMGLGRADDVSPTCLAGRSVAPASGLTERY